MGYLLKSFNFNNGFGIECHETLFNSVVIKSSAIFFSVLFEEEKRRRNIRTVIDHPTLHFAPPSASHQPTQPHGRRSYIKHQLN
jgi:hypothetical protein